MVEERLEPGGPDVSHTDVLVPVRTRSETVLRIVDVHHLEVAKTYRLIKIGQRLLNAFRRVQIETRSVGMASIETDYESIRLLDSIEYFLDIDKFGSHTIGSPGSVF